jgi:hypothetical protein
VLPHAVTTARWPRAESALLDVEPLFGDGCLAVVRLHEGTAHVRMAAAERVVLGDIERWLRECCPRAEPTEERLVPMTFWSHGGCGGTWISRKIAVAVWDEISANYPSSVRERVAPLLDPSFRPAEGGQLVLWHGPPGTGKTFALRALAWEWRRWCDVHYVVDPEVLFGDAGYLLEVALDDGDDDQRWRLLVLEDTGELMTADAKERTGQGLSRLLNLVDGIVGQGLCVLVLVTTNEPLQRLHPAVARPGRCAAKVEFAAFPPDEAAEWLAAHGAEPDGQAATLASLFASATGREAEPEPAFGFRL